MAADDLDRQALADPDQFSAEAFRVLESFAARLATLAQPLSPPTTSSCPRPTGGRSFPQALNYAKRAQDSGVALRLIGPRVGRAAQVFFSAYPSRE